MTSTHKAARLPHKQARPFSIDTIPTPTPNHREVLIRVRAFALNPVDPAIQAMGFLWENYPLVLGSDISGEIISVGKDVIVFKPGDRVTACVEQGAFQECCLADMAVVAKIPDTVSFSQGSVLPLGLTTAAVSLFHPALQALDLPSLEPKRNGKVVLVWGASSSVGSCAVQMVKAAGYDVFATASARNAQYSKDLGADQVFDHQSESVIEDIISAIEQSGKPFAGVFSAIMAPEIIGKCATIAGKLGKDEKSKTVGTVMAPGMPFNEPLPEGVQLAYCAGLAEFLPEACLLRDSYGMKMTPNEVAPAVWGKWLGPALEKGIMRCKPDPEIVGHSLDDVQEACDKMAKGVSATKLVIELP